MSTLVQAPGETDHAFALRVQQSDTPVQMVGETAYNFKCRLQQASPPTTGPNQGMARQWLGMVVDVPQAPTGWTIK